MNNKIDKTTYQTIMDTNILIGIELYYQPDIEKSAEHFKTAINCGEENINYSKEEYYNALNCAYSWLGVIYYNQKDIPNALSCFNKAVEHYNEVKDDPNYFVKEDQVIGICKGYIESLSKK